MERADDRWRPRHRVTLHEYYRMEELGLFAPESRVELIDGEILDLAPLTPRDSSVRSTLARTLFQSLGDQAMVRVQVPLTLDDHSEPMPDLAIVTFREDCYRDRHPIPSDAILVVEISVAPEAAQYDREIKVPLYARYGVPAVWLVDLAADRLDTFLEPRGGSYREVSSTPAPPTVALDGLSGIKIVDVTGWWRKER